MMRRPGLAVSLYVEGRHCVVVGDNEVAAERAERLTDAGAIVVRVRTADWCAAHARGVAMVFACDAARADEVTHDARDAGALAYALDLPDLSDLAMPALARRGPLQISVATDAAAPALARRVRAELQRLLDDAGPALDELIDDMERERAMRSPGRERREALQQVAERLSMTGKLRIEE